MKSAVGFVGLGSMGLPMAANLQAAGFALRAYNRTPGRAAAARSTAVRRSRSSPADTAEPDGVVVTMLADDAALRHVVTGEHGIGGRLGEGGVHLSMSTIAPETARFLSEYHARPRHRLRRGACLRPPRRRGGAPAMDLHFGTRGGEGPGASPARCDGTARLRLRREGGGRQRGEAHGQLSDHGCDRGDRGSEDPRGEARHRSGCSSCRFSARPSLPARSIRTTAGSSPARRSSPPASGFPWVSRTRTSCSARLQRPWCRCRSRACCATAWSPGSPAAGDPWTGRRSRCRHPRKLDSVDAACTSRFTASSRNLRSCPA